MVCFLENIWQIILMIILLLCSAFLSGSETAFFNISRRQAKALQQSANRLGLIASGLLNNPKQLLTSLLFGNMAVNVLFFALAGVLSINMGKQYGPTAGVISAALLFFILLLGGEMLPKSLAYSHSRRFCIIASPFCFLCVRILSPILGILDILIVVPAVRLFSGAGGPGRQAETVTANQLKRLIESSRVRGLISADENELFAEVIELGFLKVRHVMQPRVDITACEISDPLEKTKKLMLENSLTKIPVYKKDIDHIVGCLFLRDMLLWPEKSVSRHLKEVNFVPEQKTVESLLEFFRKSRTDMAIVVDEYGGIAGAVSLENIVEEILGPIEQDLQAEPIEQIGPLEYRLAADIAIHDWAEVFNIDPEQSRLSTIGGLTTALLGRIPKKGDVIYLKNLKLTVQEVRKRRIESLILSLEPEESKKNPH